MNGIQSLRYDGDDSAARRIDILNAFELPDSPPVILMTPQSGGVGLNITAANHVIFMDRWFNPVLHEQAEARAHRRLLELREQGDESTFEQVYEAIVERDRADMNRPVAPLKQAEDAVVVDATNLSIAQVVEQCLMVVHGRASR